MKSIIDEYKISKFNDNCACGSFFMPRFLKSWLSKVLNNRACQTHDIDYFEQLKTRSEADEDFLNTNIAKAKNWWQLIIAHLMFVFIRSFGWISYYRQKIRLHYKQGKYL